MNHLAAAMTLMAIVTLSACGPAGDGGAGASPSATASAQPIASAVPSPSPSHLPSASASPDAGAGDAGDEGDSGAWVNGYLLPGATDIHFGPDWGPTWYFTKTIGERFTDWSPSEFAVDSSCPWAATLTSYIEAGVYSIAVADPRGDTSTALSFRMVNSDLDGTPLPINGEGITIGSAMDDVLAAYPGTTVQFFNDEAWGDVYEIDAFQEATDTHMYFWSWEPHGVVQAIQWGHFPNDVSWRGHTCGG